MPISANGHPAVACYVRKPGDAAYEPLALDVLRVEDGAVIELVVFDDSTFERSCAWRTGPSSSSSSSTTRRSSASACRRRCESSHESALRPLPPATTSSPASRSHVQRRELDDALSEDDYTLREWVEAPGVRYEPVDGEHELLSGLRLVPAPGHKSAGAPTADAR